MMFFRKLLVLLTALLLSVACLPLVATAKPEKMPNALAALALEMDPLARVYTEIGADFAKYASFGIVPETLLSGTGFGDEILDRQMLFVIRSRMEQQGYKYVENVDEADLVLVAGGSTQQNTYRTEDRAITLPHYVPGSVLNSTTNVWGYGNLNTTTTTSGRWEAKTYVRSGKVNTNYLPGIRMALFERESRTRIFSGVVVGTSRSSDIRLSSFWLFPEVFKLLPAGKNAMPAPLPARFGFSIATVTGQQYVPMVTSIDKGSASDRAGLKRWDVILEADGASLANKSWAEAYRLLSQTGPLRLRVGRGSDVKNLTVEVK